MSKKLDDLRRRSAQRTGARQPQTAKQMIDIFGNREQGVFLKFTYLTDHLQMTHEQALDHAYKVIGAAVACGAKPDMKVLEAQIDAARAALAMDEKKKSEPRGGH